MATSTDLNVFQVAAKENAGIILVVAVLPVVWACLPAQNGLFTVARAYLAIVIFVLGAYGMYLQAIRNGPLWTRRPQ